MADPSDYLTVRVFDSDEECVLIVQGELDVLSSGELRDKLAGIRAQRVVVELSELTFLDASGLSALVEARRRSERNGSSLEIRGASGLVRRVFELAELGHLLTGPR